MNQTRTNQKKFQQSQQKRKIDEDYSRSNLCSPGYVEKFGPRKIKVPLDLSLDFSNLPEVLTSHAYNVDLSEGGVLAITGHSVRGYAIRPDADHCYAGFLWLDHRDCYNKISQCPCSLRLPTTAEELFRALRQIGSPAGLRLSRSFAFHDDNPFQNDSDQ